jgi:antitoxin (DNA-binding transcriptional repressor) of toxin-antitoxin stability system
MESMLSVSEFKKHALRVFEEISRSGGKVVVTKRGKPIAQVSSYQQSSQRPEPNKLSGTLIFEDDIVSPLGPDDWEVA